MTGAATVPLSSAYKRQPPPLPVRCFFGAWIYGVATPASWTLERLGLLERMFRNADARRRRMLARQNAFRNYVPAAHDVFVMTYAKSGTNWMMQIAHQLLFHGKGEFDHIHSVVPWPDSQHFGPMRHYAIPLGDPSVWQAAPEKKRVIKTHYDWDQLPYSENARYIAVIRDPKDVFVSNYFFFGQTMGPAMPSVNTWLKLFLSENFIMGGSWAVNAAGYWAQRHRPNVRVFSFKEMKRDLPGTVHEVARFLDVDVSEEVLRKVIDKSSFAYMKRHDDRFRMWNLVPWHAEGPMVRKGTQGGSAELLTRDQQRRVDEYFMAELKRLGCDLPYEEFCDVTN